MNLNENQKILVLRYGNNIIKDCIEKHIEVLTENGYCWFGKIERAPSTKVLESVLINGKGTLILYSRSASYLCGFSEVTVEQPTQGYPLYYNSYILNKGNLPSIYLKLNSIEKKDSNFLSQFVVCSSRNNLVDTLSRSMNSLFLVEDTRAKLNRTQVFDSPKISRSEGVLDENDCRYRKNGKCNHRYNVNYQYECLKPSICLKQRR